MIKSMPIINRKTMILMVLFMKFYIVKHQIENLMTAQNIAIVFGPCFFRPIEYSLLDLVNSVKFSRVILVLIQKST
jgi:Rho GTPase-activating protein 1